MNLDKFNLHCSNKPSAEKVVQWGGAHVWKVQGKIFAIASHWGQGPESGHFKIAFKASELSFQLLTEQSNIIPAPYLGRYKWVQLEAEDALTDREVRDYLDEAYRMVVAKLPKARRPE